MTKLTPNDRVLADRNIRVQVPNPRNAAGQALVEGLEAKGWQVVRQPELAAPGVYAFAVRSRQEHSFRQAVTTLAFEYGAACGFAVLPDSVELWDLGADLTAFEVLTLPVRQAAAAAADTASDARVAVGEINDRLAGAGQGLRAAGEGIAGMVRLAQIGGIVLGCALVVGGVIYLVRIVK